MKKLEELGISPAPWELWNVSCVFNKLVNLSDSYEVARAQDGTDVHLCGLKKNVEVNLANARLIAAAPELYESLREAVEYHCQDRCPAHGCGCNKDCLFYKWREALTKASGESEVVK